MYLATTRIKEFWPEGASIVLLGEWCLSEGKIYGSNSDREYTVLPYPWDDRNRFNTGAKYVQEVYDFLLPELTSALNQLHGLDKTTDYWRFIIGPWLLHYIHIFYDRYACLKEALKLDDKLVTIGIDQKSYFTPSDCLDFLHLIEMDEYNLILYTQILEVLGLKMERKMISFDKRNNVSSSNSGHNPKDILKTIFAKIKSFVGLHTLQNSDVGLVNMAIPFPIALRLLFSTHFKIAIDEDFEYDQRENLPVDFHKREVFSRIMIPRNEFEKVIIETLSQNMPTAYIETFPERRNDVLKIKPPKVIMSSLGWYFNERLKIFAAEAHENGRIIGTMQHGGYYGMLEHIHSELHEKEIGDVFYNWGWNEDSRTGKDIRRLSHPKMLLAKSVGDKRKTMKRSQQIVLVTTNHPRNLYRFQSHPVGPQWNRYFMDALQFVNFLNTKAKDKLKVRLYFSDYGRGIKKIWIDSVPGVSFDEEKRIESHLETAEMLIIDHPSTTFLEAMVANVPMLLFWNEELFDFRETAKPFFEELRKTGILHNDPISAAKKLNEIIDDPQAWWSNEEIQKAKDKFCHNFAYVSDNWEDEWKKEMKSLAEMQGLID